MISANEMFVMISDQFADNIPPLTGMMLKQTKPAFTSADFSGRTVFYMTGINPETGPNSSVFIGAADLSTGMGTYELNFGGSTIAGSNMIVTSTVFPNGRVSLSLGFKGSWIAYLVAPNTGFIMQYDDPGTMVLSGVFEQQSDPPFSNAILNGEYFGGVVDAGMSLVGYGNGIQNWNGNASWSGTGNTAAPGSVLYPDMPVSGTYTITDSSLGAGDWLGGGNYHKKFYVISPNKIVFIQTELSNVYPTLEILEK
jgi:hypothetical protein